MKILVLDGSVENNSVPLISMHLSQDYEVVSKSIVNEDLSVMRQKYDSWENVPDSELFVPMADIVDYSKELIDHNEPDILIGINFGCAVINSLILEGAWKGPTMMVDPDGAFFLSSREDFQSKNCVWFVRKNTKAFVRNNLSKLPLFKQGTIVYVNEEKSLESLHTISMIKNMAESLCS